VTGWRIPHSISKLSTANDKAGSDISIEMRCSKKNWKSEDPGKVMLFALQPLSDMHFNTNYAGFSQRVANKSTFICTDTYCNLSAVTRLYQFYQPLLLLKLRSVLKRSESVKALAAHANNSYFSCSMKLFSLRFLPHTFQWQ
jgi:hypothetical protein